MTDFNRFIMECCISEILPESMLNHMGTYMYKNSLRDRIDLVKSLFQIFQDIPNINPIFTNISDIIKNHYQSCENRSK